MPSTAPTLRISLALALAIVLGVVRMGWADEPAANPVAPAAPAAAPGPLSLRAAVEQGLVRARGTQPQSFQSLALELVNLGQERLELDLVGSYMTPRGPKSCQRLGLGPVITPGGVPKGRHPGAVVTLAAGATSTLRVATVCLDSGKSCPTTQDFQLAPDRLPPVREKVMRWWANNPEAPQSAVNSAIWRNDEEVHLSSSRPEGRREPPPELRLGVLSGSVLYVVRGDALVARDADGSERFLATQISDVFPAPGALYALATVGDGEELWRYVETGEELWKRLAPLPVETKIASLQVVPGGGLVLVTSSQVLHLAPNASEFRTLFTLPAGAAHLSCTVPSKRTVHMVFTQPPTKGVTRGGEQEQARSALPELWELDLVGRRPPERVKAYWNVASIAQGAGATFALTNAGHLRVLVGESFREQPGPAGLDEILFVGKKHLWARGRGESLLCVRISTGASVRADRSFTQLKHLRFDEESGDLLAVNGRHDLLRFDAQTGYSTDVLRQPGR